jgi:hypothetical protein
VNFWFANDKILGRDLLELEKFDKL